MTDRPPTPPATLTRCRQVARQAGLRHVYTGNVHDPEGGSTECPNCGARLIGRDRYVITDWGLGADGCCARCGTRLAGLFEAGPGTWGAKRLPVRLG